MDIFSIPQVFESRVRLAIISALITGEKNFKEIKEITKGTDGNLSVHLGKLENIGYITSKKEFVGKKPRTTYTLTADGRLGLENYVTLLEKILNEARE